MISAGARAAVLLMLAQFSPGAYASSSSVSMQCFIDAGQRYAIDPLLLYAIAHVESDLNPKAINRNRDGTIDYGVMQINSQHLPQLKSSGIDAQRLIQEPCLSVQTGASILAGMIQRHGNTWKAVGAYNAGGCNNRGQARQTYATKVWRRYATLNLSPPGKMAASPASPLTNELRERKRPGPPKTVRQPTKPITVLRWTADDSRLTHIPLSAPNFFSKKQDSQ